MTGTVITTFAGGSADPTAFWGGIILADGQYFDSADPRWIGSPTPRDGQYTFNGPTPFSVGQRVSFTPNPGTILEGGTFETASVATNVTPA